jgi:hypothetical protein
MDNRGGQTMTTTTEPAINIHGWMTPPESQGQIVERSYGVDDDGDPWMRTTDHGDGTVTYMPGEWNETDGPGEWEPWNAVPTCADFD